MSVIVKICGLSDQAGVEAAIRHGADYTGFVYFERSPRHVSTARAGELKKALPGHVKAVSVLVDPDDALLERVMTDISPDYVQLHGRETPARVAQIKASFSVGVIKALKVSDAADIGASQAFKAADMLLFDAAPPKGAQLPGGNGVAFDWPLLHGREFSSPWFLSGGLTPGNVAQAVRESGARMVDVSSGVEASPGVKDPHLIEQFIKAAKS